MYKWFKVVSVAFLALAALAVAGVVVSEESYMEFGYVAGGCLCVSAVSLLAAAVYGIVRRDQRVIDCILDAIVFVVFSSVLYFIGFDVMLAILVVAFVVVLIVCR